MPYLETSKTLYKVNGFGPFVRKAIIAVENRLEELVGSLTL